MEERIIVTMTSYPGRIKNVSKSIFLLLTKQTVKPDEIHLWLSAEEFKNKEKDLPNDLQTIVNQSDKVFLHWLQKNTYVHKRHEYFKIAKDNDLVFLIDDDVRYNDKLIESVLNSHKKYPDSIVCYNPYNTHEYIGRRILYKNDLNTPLDTKTLNKYRWCGQSMIPAKIYPKECLSDENQKIRNNTSPVSDECWFQPWIVYNNISIVYLKLGWGEDIDKNNGKRKGIVSWSHKKDPNGYEKRDNWLYAVLSSYPNILKIYSDLFKYNSK